MSRHLRCWPPGHVLRTPSEAVVPGSMSVPVSVSVPQAVASALPVIASAAAVKVFEHEVRRKSKPVGSQFGCGHDLRTCGRNSKSVDFQFGCGHGLRTCR